MSIHTVNSSVQPVINEGNTMSETAARSEKDKEEEEHDGFHTIWHVGVWMFGLAILALMDWWWPGILVLVAISVIGGTIGEEYLKRRSDRERVVTAMKVAQTARAEALPERCPACGAPLSTKSVIWRSESTASCPYCNTSVKATRV